MRTLIALVGFLLPGIVPAQPASPADEGGAVVIQPRLEEQRVEEYRLNGRLFMIKIIPKKGPPYYLIDSDGDGVMESRQDDLDPNMPVPSWVLLRW